TPSRDLSLELAPQACQSCRSGKRRCDKALPKCSSCANRGRTCEYRWPEPSRHSTAASDPERGWYPSPLDEEQQRDARTVDFPTILFLDPGLLQHGQVDTAHSTVSVPPYILHLLGDLGEIRLTASRFFKHIHQWMPFISKKRFYDMYLQPAFHTRPDVVLLLLAQKLITTFPPA
ncbi:hypothetical protein KXW76_008567, partial [Aspergillus fumigatus]